MYRVKHTMEILASLDTSEKRKGFERSGDTVTQTIRNDFTVGKSDTRVIAKSTVDEALGFGGVTTAGFLYVEVDREVKLKINGGTQEFKLAPATGSVAKLLWEGEFTSLTVSNEDTINDATLTYAIAGA